MSPFRDAFLDAPIGIIVIDLEHRFLEANPAFLDMLGYTREELIAMGPLYDLTHPDDRVGNEELVSQLRAETIPGFTIEKRYVAKDGHAVWGQVHTSLLRDPVTRVPVSILGLIVNITDRKRAEEIAAIETARARNVLEATSDCVYTVDREWRITYVNQSAIDAVNFKPSDLGRNFWELYPHAMENKMGPALRRAMYDRLPSEFEEYYPEPHQIHYTASVYPTDEGVTVFYRDITEKRRAELALRESEKMAVVGRLAASIAHEINNPLEAITNLLYLARQHDLEPDVAEYLRVAESELQRVSHIATLTLSFHRQMSTPTAITARSLFGSVLDLYRSRLVNLGITPVLGHLTETPFECLEGEVRQVLANLVANAIDAMRCGGTLYLRAHLACDHASKTPGVRLTIADTGHGIPAAVQKKIFEAFFTTKELGGTGLGLWLSRSIVENHGGRLGFRSREGKGTVFSMFFPLTAVAGLHASRVVPN
jgi:PAS domain S-box-containing protein